MSNYFLIFSVSFDLIWKLIPPIIMYFTSNTVPSILNPDDNGFRVNNSVGK